MLIHSSYITATKFQEIFQRSVYAEVQIKKNNHIRMLIQALRTGLRRDFGFNSASSLLFEKQVHEDDEYAHALASMSLKRIDE